jgi:hypothetical protein
MKNQALLSSALSLCGFFYAGVLLAQAPRVDFPAASPPCSLKQRVGLTDIEVSYSRPGVKNREIFGGIVPYGQVWRTGANQATKISFSTPVKLNGMDVPAGSYALFTIPGEQEWTVILNKTTNQWGSFRYDEKTDFTRVKATPRTLAINVETFTINFTDIRDESAVLYLAWDNVLVPVKIEMDVTSKVVPQIEAAMASPDKKQAGFYFQAATFYYNHDLDLKKALTWLNTGLEDKSPIAYELLHLKAKILAKQGDKEGAIAAAKQSSDLAIKAEGPNSSFVKMNQDLISGLH